MSMLLSGIGWGLAVATCVPLAVFVAELLAGLPPGRGYPPGRQAASVAVLIPAHDEAAGIGATLAELARVAPAGTRVLVVADNCSDETAALARAAGVEVAERNDPSARGKGFALAFGRRAVGLLRRL